MAGRRSRFPSDKGFFNTYTIADPGSNADVIWTPPANMIVQPLTMSLILFAENAGVARSIFLSVQAPTGTVVYGEQYPQTHPLNATLRYSAHLGAAKVNLALGEINLTLPEVYLTDADSITFLYTAKQALDRVTAFRVAGLEWRNTP